MVDTVILDTVVVVVLDMVEDMVDIVGKVEDNTEDKDKSDMALVEVVVLVSSGAMPAKNGNPDCLTTTGF